MDEPATSKEPVSGVSPETNPPAAIPLHPLHEKLEGRRSPAAPPDGRRYPTLGYE